MLTKYQFAVTLPPEIKLNSSYGSIFHGALMELLPDSYANELHEKALRPFSQAVYTDREQGNVWEINSLNEEFQNEIEKLLPDLTDLYLKQKGFALALKLINKKETSYEQLADNIFLAPQPPRGVSLKLYTATSFKQNNGYVLFPTAELIIGSLLAKWNTFTDGQTLVENNLKEKLAALVSIYNYKLRSSRFFLEKTNINGFVGTINFNFHGSDMQKRLLGLLFSFAPYAGIGIKTALGMGAVAADLKY